MLNKLFFLFAVFGIYIWGSSHDLQSLYSQGQSLCKFVAKIAEDNNISVHIHDADCLKKALEEE